MGHAVVLAADGKQALEALLGNAVDLVLMDIQMPSMSGLDAVTVIRNDPGYAHKSKVPIIALTADALKGDEQRFLDAGMDGYLSKPVDIENLHDALSQVTWPGRRNK